MRFKQSGKGALKIDAREQMLNFKALSANSSFVKLNKSVTIIRAELLCLEIVEKVPFIFHAQIHDFCVNSRFLKTNR